MNRKACWETGTAMAQLLTALLLDTPELERETTRELALTYFRDEFEAGMANRAAAEPLFRAMREAWDSQRTDWSVKVPEREPLRLVNEEDGA